MARKKKQEPVPDRPTPVPEVPVAKSKDLLHVAIITIIACVLLLTNLGNQYLWQDEAQTACIARTIIAHGIPLGSDGVNSFSQEWGAEYGENLVWRWHTWLPFYILALFFKLFGESNFVCRLPFALFGVGCVVMAYYLGMALWGGRRAGVVSAALMLLSVPFLILMRECRYYSMSVLFSMWGLYAYVRILEGRRHAGTWFVIVAVLLFQSHYIYYASLLATVVLHSAIFHRERLKAVLIPSLISGAINLPWIIWLSGANFQGALSYKFKPILLAREHRSQFSYFGDYYFELMRRHISPWFLYPLPLVLAAFNRVREKRFPQPDRAMWNRVALIAIFIVVNWLTVTILSPFPHFRYLAPIIPAFWLIGALMLDRWMRVHTLIGIALLVLLFFAGTSRDFIYELTHDYDGPVEGTVKYLLANGNDGDLVVAPREEMPLKFYTKMKVIGGLSEEHPIPPKDPDWVILRTVMLPTEQELAQRMAKMLDLTKYEMVVLDGYPDIPFENREDPVDLGHNFWTVTTRPPVQLLRRIAE